MTNSSQTQLAFIAEVTPGTTPATPAFQKLRFTSENLKANIQTQSSDEIRADRNIPDMAQVGAAAAGDIGFELSYGTYDTFFESLQNGAWSTNVLKNGVTPKTMTLEKLFEAGATDQYHRFVSSVVNTMSLNVRAGEKVTGSFGMMSTGMTTAQAIIASATYTDPNSNPIINAASHFASLAMTGVTSPAIMGLALNVTNNARHQQVVGSLSSRGIATGRFQVSGTIDAYFENQELLDLFIAGTASDLSFKLGGASALNYTFDVPNLKFSDAEIIAGGNDQDVMARMSFTGLYDTSDACTLKITRDPS